MQKGFYRRWFARGFRLSLVLGIVAAAWESWYVVSQYEAERSSWAKLRLLYECAARLDDDVIEKRKSEFGTFNVKGLCAFDGEDHWVSFAELADVRSGVMKFETDLEPFSMARTARAGLYGFFRAILATLALLSAIRLVQWVWGRAAS